MSRRQFTRRRFLATTAAASAVAIGAPYVRTSRAAGKLSVGFWDHWVPGANDTLTAICQEWAKKENVELKIDYITSQGNKIMMTATAESQAQSGHDILQFVAWYPLSLAKSLEPVDDVMGGLLKQNGKVSPVIEYLGKSQGHWLGVPAVTGTQVKPPCARIDLLKSQCGIDVQAMYPAGKPPTKEAEHWNWDNFVVAAEKAFKAGNPFGLGLGQTTDSVDWVGSLFASYGAQLVDAKGNITVKSDPVKQVLEYAQRLVKALPPDVFAWDDASNNRYLISGQGSLIFNPPSAWAVAKRVNASGGYDIPSFDSMRNFKVWEEVGPPMGTVYHYPPRTQVLSMAGSPAPSNIAQQMYVQAINTKMIARCTQGGESIDKVLAWAASELEGYSRT